MSGTEAIMDDPDKAQSGHQSEWPTNKPSIGAGAASGPAAGSRDTPESSLSSTALRPVKAVIRELGLTTLYSCAIDTKILILQRFVRLFAYGGSTLILASYLSDLGNSDQRIGLFMTLTLIGDVFISFLLTLVADGLGRRWILVLGAGLMAVSGIVFGLSGNFWILLAGAILGVISPA
jgi:hypothetical protein